MQPRLNLMLKRDRAGRRFLLGLAVLEFGLLLTAADIQAQSLGDLAAREAAPRAAIMTAAHVCTNVPQRAQPSVLASVIASVPPDQNPSVAPFNLQTMPAGPGTSVMEVDASPVQPAAFASLAGWSTFEIKKTPAELAETARLADDPQNAPRTGPRDVSLPPQHDVFRVSTGIGYLQGADFGGDVSGSGKINGMQTDVSAFLTAGPMGFEARSGRVSVFAPDGKWRGEGGDLYSDLRGLARGARLSWNPGQRWTPSVSLYLKSDGPSKGTTVLAYRDRVQLLPHMRVGGEVTTDGAAFLQGQYGLPRVNLDAFYRFTKSPIAGHDKGVSAGLNMAGGVAVTGALRLSDAVGDSSQGELASVRLPLARQASVTLERSWWSGSSNDGAINALTLQLPMGPVRLLQRLQWGRTDYLQRAVPFGFDLRQSQSTASYTPGPWGNFNYQQSTQLFDDGRVQQWDEISSMLQLGHRTAAQFVTAFPDISDPQRLRLRVTQRLSPTLSLDLQYGRLSAFQLTRASEGEQSRVMVTIRKTWQVESPSRGGDVQGRASDQMGYPVSGALVRLGPYSAITDKTGVYRFARVPDGEFELALDRNKLPVSYAWDETPRALAVTRQSHVNVDLQVIPLNAIRGHVYIDHNDNGHFDEGEGIPNAVVAADGAVTATGATGAYGFYNQAPGRYTIRLDAKRLSKGLASASPAELEVELTGNQPLVGVDFKVEKKDMPIIMRGIGQ
jgi:hypothetical protein